METNSLLQIFKEELQELLHSWEKVCINLEDGFSSDLIRNLFRLAHTIKGSAKVAGCEDLGSFIHMVEDYIRLAQSQTNIDRSLFIRAIFEAHANMHQFIVSSQIEEKSSADTIALLKQATSQASENVAEKTTKKVVEKENIQQEKPEEKQEVQIIFRIKENQIDDISNAATELLMQLSTLKYYFRMNKIENIEMNETLELCRKYGKGLREKCFSLRLQEVDRLFQSLERAARDVARTLNKAIVVEKIGAETEIDRSIIDKISTPFIHLVRNAVDHGIENAEKRKELKKPVIGTLRISAQNKVGSVEIVIADDGRGINRARVLQIGKDKGLVKAGQILTDQEIMQLIFLPGFSTSEKVSDISGRGVGLDVVFSTLEEISGTIEIESEEGKGTKFKIEIPTNIALFDGLIIKNQGRFLCVPLLDIAEVVETECLEIVQNEARERFFMYRGEIISVLAIEQYLPLVQTKAKPDPKKVAVIYRSVHCSFAILVEAIEIRHELHIKALDHYIENLAGISGRVVLPDGTVSLMLSLSEIAKSVVEKRNVA